ncbi:MAG: signal peptidase II [Defluviitaleaceae bacterium]|nr:signal peptidase II [Defluviitaleaceae bacterium]
MTIIKKYVLPIAFVLLLLAIDQFTKHLAVTHLYPVGEVVLIDGVFSLLFTTNAGMAFGLLQGGRWLFVVLTVVIMCGLVYYYIKMPEGRFVKAQRVLLLVLAAGALGNFVDRLMQGYVVDFFFFSFINFPVFNVADIFLVVSIPILGLLMMLPPEKPVKKNG